MFVHLWSSLPVPVLRTLTALAPHKVVPRVPFLLCNPVCLTRLTGPKVVTGTSKVSPPYLKGVGSQDM